MKFLLLVSLYMLGCARGAPSQLDEPPGSLTPQGAVQQFSGEPFSLATPSDREALFETFSARDALSKQAAFEHALVGRASGEQISGVQAPAEQTSNEQSLAIEAAHEQAAHEQAAAEQAATGQPSGEHPSGEHPSGEHPSGEHPSGEQPSGEHPSGEQPSGEHPSGEQPSGEHPSGEHPSGVHPLGEQPSGERTSWDHPSGRPAATRAGPGINCHTCSYMDSEGKCLRGEGSCTIQNSQQCMLKKIFEGGKLEFMVQGCENMCPSMSLFSHGTKMQLFCCRDASFCNKT